MAEYIGSDKRALSHFQSNTQKMINKRHKIILNSSIYPTPKLLNIMQYIPQYIQHKFTIYRGKLPQCYRWLVTDKRTCHDHMTCDTSRTRVSCAFSITVTPFRTRAAPDATQHICLCYGCYRGNPSAL